MTTLRTSPDTLILTFLFERTQATAAEIRALSDRARQTLQELRVPPKVETEEKT